MLYLWDNIKTRIEHYACRWRRRRQSKWGKLVFPLWPGNLLTLAPIRVLKIADKLPVPSPALLKARFFSLSWQAVLALYILAFCGNVNRNIRFTVERRNVPVFEIKDRRTERRALHTAHTNPIHSHLFVLAPRFSPKSVFQSRRVSRKKASHAIRFKLSDL